MPLQKWRRKLGYAKNPNFLLAMVTCLGFFLRFYNIESERIITDEGHYGTVARNILFDPKFLFYPSINRYTLDVDKPPLFFQVLAVGMFFFGENEFGLRFFPALFGSLTPLIVCALVKRHYGSAAGLCAAMFVSLTPFCVAISRHAFMESTIIFYCLLSLYFFVKGLEEGKPRYYYLASILIAVNFLTKVWQGVIPLFALLPYAATFLEIEKVKGSRQTILIKIEKLKKNGLLWHGVLALIISVPLSFSWYIIGSLLGYMDGNLWQLPFGLLLLGRFRQDGRFVQPWDFYFKEVFLTESLGIIFVPSLFGLIYLISRVRRERIGLLYIFLLLPFFVYCLAPWKSVLYVYDAVIAFSILAAVALTRIYSWGRGLTIRGRLWGRGLTITCILLLVVNTFYSFQYTIGAFSPREVSEEKIISNFIVRFLRDRGFAADEPAIFVPTTNNVHTAFEFYCHPYRTHRIYSYGGWRTTIQVYVIDKASIRSYPGITSQMMADAHNLTDTIYPTPTHYQIYFKAFP